MGAKKRGAATVAKEDVSRSSTPLEASATTDNVKGASPSTLSSSSSGYEIAIALWQRYITETPQRILLLDAFMAFLVVVGVIQFVYCVVFGSYPFNAFLSGFSAAVGQFVLTASLRMQTSEKSRALSKAKKGQDGSNVPSISSERAFADYVFGSLILHFFCINFIN